MTRRIKTLGLPVQTLLALVRGPVLPADAKILVAREHPTRFTMDGSPPIDATAVRLGIWSQSFPETDLGTILPDLGIADLGAVSPGAATLTLTVEQLRELAYDAERLPGRRVALAVHRDGTWERTGL